MTELTQDLSLAQAHSLIDSYDFDLGNEPAEQLLQNWLDVYHASWIRLATIEALYLGRYKAISIEHILNVWMRIGTPNTHFTYEFERLICRKLPKHLSNLSGLVENVEPQKVIKTHSFLEPKKPLTEVTEVAEVKVESTNKTSATADSSRDELLNLATAWEKSQATSNLSTSNLSRQSQQAHTENIPIIDALKLAYTPDLSEFTGKNKMITQFIPLPDFSSFFNRLKTFGSEKLEG